MVKKLQARLGFKTAGLLYGNDDAFTQAGYTVMKGALDGLGIKIVGTQTFAKPTATTTPSSPHSRRRTPRSFSASALAENASGIVSQARQLGWSVPVMGGNGFNSPAFIKNAGPAAEGVYVGTAWNRVSADPANRAFLELMKEKKIDPDQFTAQAYTGVLVVAEAIKLAGMKGDRESIRAGFAKVKDLPTPLGKFSFLDNRDGSHEPAVQQVKDGQFQIVP